MSEESLPEGWARLSLADAGAWSAGGTPSRKVSAYFGGGIPWVKSGDLNDSVVTSVEETLSQSGLQNSSAKVLPKGTVSIAMYGATIGKTGIFGLDAATNQACANCRVHEGLVDRKFLLYFLQSQKDEFVGAGQGGAQPNISATILKAWPFLLAPLPEQHRIVEKVEALLEQVNRAKERLDRVPLILKRFRQAVLAAACSGQLGHAREAAVAGPLEFLPELPHGWRWMTAEETCSRVVDCHNKTAPYTETGIRLLRTTNIRGGKLVLDDARFVSEETYKFWSRRCPPEPGDVLFTREAPMGEAALIPPGMKICMGQRMMLLRADRKLLSPEYLLLAVQAPYVHKYAEHVAVGSGVLHMRVGDVERMPIPVPPKEEQAALVTLAKSALSFVDKVEERLDRATHRAEQIPQSILSKAFAGELVPTEAELARLEGRTYETAEELLKRVTALGSDVPSARKGRGRRTG